MKIAIDAMGGDKGPEVIVKGILKVNDRFEDISYLLFGDKDKILAQFTDEVPQNIEIIHTTEEIYYDDEPVRAVRRKKDSSMVQAARAVKEGRADALLSAGNTGALMAAGLLFVGRLKHIERPGLMTTLPVIQHDGGFDFIDVGANSESLPQYLNDYAVLGSFYAKYIRGIEKPRVGLLNNGEEATKGNSLTKEAYQLLVENEEIHFIGNVEARDLLNDVADVVVADGFTGNAVLKAIEGTALSVVRLLKQNILDLGFKGKMGTLLLKDALLNVKDKMDYTSHNGAVLMGVKAPVVKTHGSSTEDTIAACIDQIHTMIEKQVIEHIIQAFDSEETEM